MRPEPPKHPNAMTSILNLLKPARLLVLPVAVLALVAVGCEPTDDADTAPDVTADDAPEGVDAPVLDDTGDEVDNVLDDAD